MVADEEGCGFAHEWDVEVVGGRGCGWDGRVGEEVAVVALGAVEAGGEVGGWGGAPGEDADVGGEETVEDLGVGEFIGVGEFVVGGGDVVC